MAIPILFSISMQSEALRRAGVDEPLQSALDGDLVGAEGPVVFGGLEEREGGEGEVARILVGEGGKETGVAGVGCVEEGYIGEVGEGEGGRGEGVSGGDCDGEFVGCGKFWGC